MHSIQTIGQLDILFLVFYLLFIYLQKKLIGLSWQVIWKAIDSKITFNWPLCFWWHFVGYFNIIKVYCIDVGWMQLYWCYEKSLILETLCEYFILLWLKYWWYMLLFLSTRHVCMTSKPAERIISTSLGKGQSQKSINSQSQINKIFYSQHEKNLIVKI